MGRIIKIATCNLNQWALDFDGNTNRILESIKISKKKNCQIRIGPELEICGYGCLDHFYENELYDNCWEIYKKIITHPESQDILLDIGMPVIHKTCRYNCRVISYNKKILLIRPKLFLANNGNYREMRYFTPWMKQKYFEEYQLPHDIFLINSQKLVLIGDCIIQTCDTKIGFEICEELFIPFSPHINLFFEGVEIVCNSSGSHHELNKRKTRTDFFSEATKKYGGIYVYSNQRGCDGDRLYYDGCSSITMNGELLSMASQFSLLDVEIVTATVDLNDVKSYRNQISSALQSKTIKHAYKTIDLDIRLTRNELSIQNTIKLNKVIKLNYNSTEEEMLLGPACWLWDYLRRSKMGGFFLPLSGGLDSCATALIVYRMCKLVFESIDNETVLSDLREITETPDFLPTKPQDIVKKIFYTSYIGTENSSKETRSRAKKLSSAIGSYHLDFNMDIVVDSVIKLFEFVTGKKPVYKLFGGSDVENLSLQNLQSRLRMVLSYLFAKLLPWLNKKKKDSLVLGSTNIDECLRGYITKYDCSSADLNPIGSLTKKDLRYLVKWSLTEFQFPLLNEFLECDPTAELEPSDDNYVQKDEVDMELTYDELNKFGELRKMENCGPWTMFCKLYHEWSLPPYSYESSTISEKVKKFWFYYSINRHKMTILTPCYYAKKTCPDDNRNDLRPFLIDPFFSYSSAKIDSFIKKNYKKHEN